MVEGNHQLVGEVEVQLAETHVATDGENAEPLAQVLQERVLLHEELLLARQQLVCDENGDAKNLVHQVGAAHLHNPLDQVEVERVVVRLSLAARPHQVIGKPHLVVGSDQLEQVVHLAVDVRHGHVVDEHGDSVLDAILRHLLDGSAPHGFDGSHDEITQTSKRVLLLRVLLRRRLRARRGRE